MQVRTAQGATSTSNTAGQLSRGPWHQVQARGQAGGDSAAAGGRSARPAPGCSASSPAPACRQHSRGPAGSAQGRARNCAGQNSQQPAQRTARRMHAAATVSSIAPGLPLAACDGERKQARGQEAGDAAEEHRRVIRGSIGRNPAERLLTAQDKPSRHTLGGRGRLSPSLSATFRSPRSEQ